LPMFVTFGNLDFLKIISNKFIIICNFKKVAAIREKTILP